MKNKSIFFCLFFLFGISGYSQDQEIDSSEDEKLVKLAVVRFADSVYYMHKEYKFEKFHADYSEEYFIQIMRSRVYKERVEDLERDKKSGRYKKSDADYEKEHAELKDAYTKVQNSVDNFKNRVNYYKIHFWTNIQTNDGITVYYEQIMELDNDYQVTSAIINSSIGAKSDKTEILYKKGKSAPKKKLTIEENNGSVQIIVPDSNPVKPEPSEELKETPKERKKRLKKESKQKK